MLALALALSILIPNPNNLGVDSWDEREAWTGLYSNSFSAIQLPTRHEDPEIQHRIVLIRSTALRHLDPRYVERLVYEKDYPRWVKEYVYGGKNTYTEYETFLACRAHYPTTFFAILKPMGGDHASTIFMEGGITPGEFEQYLGHLLRYRLPVSVEAPYAIVKGFVYLSSN